MALNKSEGKYAGEYLCSEANGELSRDTVTLLTSATVYQPGDVLGIISATGKACLCVYTATDGSDVARCINYARQDASAGDIAGAPVTARDAEVNKAELNFGTSDATTISNMIADLAANRIFVRTGV